MDALIESVVAALGESWCHRVCAECWSTAFGSSCVLSLLVWPLAEYVLTKGAAAARLSTPSALCCSLACAEQLMSAGTGCGMVCGMWYVVGVSVGRH